METCERLIIIGSTGRNSGKTFLAAELIKHFDERPLTALKVTSIERLNDICPRNGKGCGACAIDRNFCLEEELSDSGSKDTTLLRAAGADRVFWLRCLRTALAEGFAAFMEHSGGGGGPVICESNSLREVINPALFIMIRDSEGGKSKASAEKAAGKSDITLQSPVSAKDIEELLKILSKKGFHFKQKEI